jgi:hypothetical protein
MKFIRLSGEGRNGSGVQYGAAAPIDTANEYSAGAAPFADGLRRLSKIGGSMASAPQS